MLIHLFNSPAGSTLISSRLGVIWTKILPKKSNFLAVKAIRMSMA